MAVKQSFLQMISFVTDSIVYLYNLVDTYSAKVIGIPLYMVCIMFVIIFVFLRVVLHK